MGGHSSNPDVSADGNLVVYESSAGNLVPMDTNGQQDIFQTFSPQGPFIRGDSNGDGKIDVADAIWTLNWLNSGTAPPPCHDAADFNDDSTINQVDAEATFGFLFEGLAPPACPFTCTAVLSCCGRDPTGDGLPCGQALAGCTPFASNGSCSICQ